MAETGAHLVGVGRRQLLRVAKTMADWTDWEAVGAKRMPHKERRLWGALVEGRALIGRTIACSAAKGA